MIVIIFYLITKQHLKCKKCIMTSMLISLLSHQTNNLATLPKIKKKIKLGILLNTLCGI
jgi:hypothetical protein